LSYGNGRSSLDKGGPEKRVDNGEPECDNVLVGDCDGGSEKDDGLERVMDVDMIDVDVMDLDLATRSCDRYSEGRGKYVCRGDVESGLCPSPREYILYWDITVLVRIGGDRWELSGGS